jgi:hypothetical protein
MNEDIIVANTINRRMTLQAFTLADLHCLDPQLTRRSSTSSSYSRPPSPASPGSSALPLPPLPPTLPWGPNTERWRSLHLALHQLIGTNRPEFAVDLLSLLLHSHPTFLPAAFTLLSCLLYAWCSGGTTGAKQIREDFLEEGVALLVRLRETHRHRSSTPGNGASIFNAEFGHQPPPEPESGSEEQEQEQGSCGRESDFLLLLEKTFFWNSFRTARCNARTLSLMASLVLASQFPEFGAGYTPLLVGHGSGVGRARRLIDRAREGSAFRDAETVSLRVTVLENLFEAPHESVLKQRVAMRDLLEDTASVTAEGVSKPVSVDLECFRAGEVLLVCGKLVTSRLLQRPSEPSQGHRCVGEEVSPSLSKLNHLRETNKAKWTLAGHESVLTTIRPLVLLPLEVEQLYAASVRYFAHSTGRPVEEIQMRSKWKTLSEFVTQVSSSYVEVGLTGSRRE